MPDARPIIRLSEPARAGTEADLVREVLDGAIWHGDGPMTQRATYWLRERLGAPGALMTSSCTHALDMAARLIGLGPGDEAIVPSFTFLDSHRGGADRGDPGLRRRPGGHPQP